MEEIIKGTGNVLEDLDLPEPSERFAKAVLARKISEIMAKRHLTQVDTATIL